MSSQKKGFGAFIRPQIAPTVEAPTVKRKSREAVPAHGRGSSDVSLSEQPQMVSTQPAKQGGDRIQHVTSTGRVRTYSANRQLPGITLRLSEERWERLKMMSIQERRPLQEILGEAMDRYMQERGLPW